MTCATCRYYRRSVVGQVGFCGLDRTRALLAGDEVRPCWQAPTDLVDLVSDRPGSGRTSWLTLAQRQRTAAAPRSVAMPVTPVAPTRDTPPILAPPRTDPSLEVPAPPSSGPGVDADDLVEAPIVQPSRKLVSEAQRRAQARRERQLSPIDDERVL